MPKSLIKKLTSKQILQKLLALKPGDSFGVWTRSERVIAMRTAKLLKDCGRIEHTIGSRENGHGEYIFFIVPS